MQLSVATRERMLQGYWEAVEAAFAAVPDDGAEFGTLEEAMEAALRQVGGPSLAAVVAEQGTGRTDGRQPCSCGGEHGYHETATRTIWSVVGAVPVARAAYRCRQCGATAYPLEAQLDLPVGQLSQRLQARLSVGAALEPLVPAVELFAELTGLRVSAKQVQLVSEAVGTAVDQAASPPTASPSPPPAAPVARLYLGVDGVMSGTNERDAAGAFRWREAKVGVFLQPKLAGAPGTGRRSRLAPTGSPVDVADPTSQQDVVHLGSWQEFASKVWQLGQRLGLETAAEIVVLGDGAVWIRSLVEEILTALPGRVLQILDLRHAEQHLWAVAQACCGDQTLAWIQTPLEHLREGRVAELIAALQTLTPPTDEAAELVATTVTYYEERRALMDYPTFRAQGLQIGSGVAESACKRLVSQRAAGPGMHWSVAGAQAILTLRAARLSGRWLDVLAAVRARSRRRAA